MAERAFTSADGVKVVGDWLDGTGATPVILLHGGGQTRHSWGPTAAALAGAGWPTLSADLRGHGDSAWAGPGGYELDDYARDVIGWAAEAGAPPVLVGASLGGMSALRALELDPPVDAAGLVLVDIAHRFEVAGAERVVSFMSSQEDFTDPSEATEAVASYLEGTRDRPADSSGIHKNLRRAEGGGWRWHWDPALVGGTTDVLERRGETEQRFMTTLEGLEIPVLLVWGGLSDIITPAIAAEFARLNPAAEAVEVPRTGHMIAGDSNEPFTAAVLDFLERRIPGTRPDDQSNSD
jgi:pimeloyl-ACP methyl ester carboxylesterase